LWTKSVRDVFARTKSPVFSHDTGTGKVVTSPLLEAENDGPEDDGVDLGEEIGVK